MCYLNFLFRSAQGQAQRSRFMRARHVVPGQSSCFVLVLQNIHMSQVFIQFQRPDHRRSFCDELCQLLVYDVIYTLHHIVGRVRHKTNACGPDLVFKNIFIFLTYTLNTIECCRTESFALNTMSKVRRLFGYGKCRCAPHPSYLNNHALIDFSFSFFIGFQSLTRTPRAILPPLGCVLRDRG